MSMNVNVMLLNYLVTLINGLHCTVLHLILWCSSETYVVQYNSSLNLCGTIKQQKIASILVISIVANDKS